MQVSCAVQSNGGGHPSKTNAEEGGCGTAGDAKDVTPYLNSQDEMIQNVADETELLQPYRLGEFVWRRSPGPSGLSYCGLSALEKCREKSVSICGGFN
jgi:hypothetical protein